MVKFISSFSFVFLNFHMPVYPICEYFSGVHFFVVLRVVLGLAFVFFFFFFPTQYLIGFPLLVFEMLFF